MTRIILFLFALGIILSNTQMAFADEKHSQDKDVSEAAETFRNGTSTEQTEDETDHQTSIGEDHGSHEPISEDHGDHEAVNGDHGDHAPVSEDHGGHPAASTSKEDSHSDGDDAHSSGDTESGHEDGGHSTGDTESGHEDGGQTTAETESGHDEEGGGHGHGPVVEAPPNFKVLGTYGAVNAAFILIGVWNKWFRRKGE